ncbi:Beta-glucosidase/6-phospho-beta-glucosidase/ beta- galactosidase [Synechocystis sp. PCC 6714]|nr:Beta-glucosidase/6-phospho-beta-glucosidase/ beta- galactosidase [Synechocystis sp. PCC 6714]
MEDGFEAGVDLALRETNLPIRVFPEVCPYPLASVLQENFLCDTSQDWG